MKRFCLLILISAPAYCVELSLLDVLKKVESQNTEIRAAKEQTKASEYGYEAAVGKYYPKVDLETRYTHLNDEIDLDLSSIRKAIIASGATAAGVTGGPAAGGAVAAGLNASFPAFDLKVQKQDYFNAAVTLTQPIYAGGKISANRDAKYNDWKATEIQSEDVRDRLLVAAAQAYFAVNLTQKAYEVRKELRDGLANHQKISANLLAEGQLTKVAMMNGKSNFPRPRANFYGPVTKMNWPGKFFQIL